MAGETQRRFAERVKQLRKARGLSQEAMAGVLHIHWTNYAKLERAERKVSLDEAADIARFLGESLDHLVAPANQWREALLVELASHAHILREMTDLQSKAADIALRLQVLTGQEAKSRALIDKLTKKVAHLEGGATDGEHQEEA
jgi:transcriptional regulator with XRE-family HTH domain